MEKGRGPGTSSLADEKNEVTRARIRRAAVTVLAQRGFRATIDEIAAVADISPRTVFRHYTGHDELVVDAIGAMTRELGAPIDGLPDPADDLEGWLWRLAFEAQRRNADIVGRAFWDFYNPPPETSRLILKALAGRRSGRGAVDGVDHRHGVGARPRVRSGASGIGGGVQSPLLGIHDTPTGDRVRPLTRAGGHADDRHPHGLSGVRRGQAAWLTAGLTLSHARTVSFSSHQSPNAC